MVGVDEVEECIQQGVRKFGTVVTLQHTRKPHLAKDVVQTGDGLLVGDSAEEDKASEHIHEDEEVDVASWCLGERTSQIDRHMSHGKICRDGGERVEALAGDLVVLAGDTAIDVCLGICEETWPVRASFMDAVDDRLATEVAEGMSLGDDLVAVLLRRDGQKFRILRDQSN
jgi:hypothetical protein